MTSEAFAAARYPEIISRIESFGVMPDRPPSLEPTTLALKELGVLDRVDPARVVVVAGTNGKGSVCAALDELWRSAGKRVGLYTSPHLVDTTERIRVDGRSISHGEFVEAFEAVAPAIERHRLSHFEALTVMAAWVFFSGVSAPSVDLAIFEVGLGGLWDATNAIPHATAIITTLDYDHQNLLGATLPEIAANKFGIIGQGAKVIHHPITSLPQAVIDLAGQVKAKTSSRWVERCEFQNGVEHHGRDPVFMLTTPWGKGPVSLVGLRGAENAALALTAFAELGGDPRAHFHALSHVNWPGRMEKWNLPGALCPVYLSGDHNPQGVRSLVELLGHYPRRRLHMIVGVGKDKDLDGVLAPLMSLPDTVLYLTETPFRGRSLSSYGSWLARASFSSASPKACLTEACKAAHPEDLVLVTGSLYLVGELTRSLMGQS